MFISKWDHHSTCLSAKPGDLHGRFLFLVQNLLGNLEVDCACLGEGLEVGWAGNGKCVCVGGRVGRNKYDQNRIYNIFKELIENIVLKV